MTVAGEVITTLSMGGSGAPYSLCQENPRNSLHQVLPPEQDTVYRKQSCQNVNMRENACGAEDTERCPTHPLSSAKLGPQAPDGPAEVVHPPVDLSGGE